MISHLQKQHIFTLLLVTTNFVFSQVGINTTAPLETLHVNGSVRIENTTPNATNSIKLIGIDANGTINEVLLGDNVSLVGGTLSATGKTTYPVAIITDNFANQTINNLDLSLPTTNLNKTVFLLRQSTGSAQSVIIRGISGGTDGRMIILKTDSQNFGIQIKKENTNADPQNRFKLNNDTNVNGFGSFTFVYVGSDQRWHLISRQL